jgi:hypothetical protein
MRFLVYIILAIFSISCFAQINQEQKDSFPNYGNETKKSVFFRERFLQNDLVNYLDNLNDFVTYESETTGSFNLPDALVFSVSGNSFKWNKFYLDGFRINNRFAPGSSFFQPDLSNQILNIDYYHSVLSFNSDSIIPNSLALRYNVGGLGGISPFTKDLINLYHSTASERAFKPIEYRNKIKSAGNVFLNYNLPITGKQYLQQLYADFGTRMLVGFDETGINNYYPENFSKLQLSGQLPFTFEKLFDETNYLFHASQRQNLYSEFNFSKDESAKTDAYSFSFYGSKEKDVFKYTSGFTLATNNIQHNNLNFNRNLIDQDGEGFEPWYPSGSTTELSHSLNFLNKLTSNLQLTFDSYNSLIHFSPTQSTFQNQIYSQNTPTSLQSTYQSLYVYDWQSNPFTSGLLENTLGLKIEKKLSGSLDLKANVDLTFDAMILSEKSMFRPNWQGQLGFYFHPAKWFSMEFNLSKNRVSFNYDDIRYFSNDYLNGDVYYWKDANNDKIYQQNEKSVYFTSTGGKYHNAIKNLQQQSYFVLDIPFYFRFGHSEFSMLNTYKKYYNNWTTRFENDATNYVYKDDQGIYFYKPGDVNNKINYIVDYSPVLDVKSNIITNTPFYVSQTMKYQYSNNKLLFSFSWCSFLMAGVSALGNGPLSNNIGVYSETSANPNTNNKLVGRLDQDRAYVARILLSYKLNKQLSFAFTGKFKDGQPFTSFDTKLATDGNGNKQMAIWNDRTKGINPFNGDFGTRKDAFFNIDFRTSFKGNISNYAYEIDLMIYNIYDFGTELAEYTFEPDNIGGRYAMELNIPRGLKITAKVYF